jgi:hypothetical protein
MYRLAERKKKSDSDAPRLADSMRRILSASGFLLGQHAHSPTGFFSASRTAGAEGRTFPKPKKIDSEPSAEKQTASAGVTPEESAMGDKLPCLPGWPASKRFCLASKAPRVTSKSTHGSLRANLPACRISYGQLQHLHSAEQPERSSFCMCFLRALFLLTISEVKRPTP